MNKKDKVPKSEIEIGKLKSKHKIISFKKYLKMVKTLYKKSYKVTKEIVKN